MWDHFGVTMESLRGLFGLTLGSLNCSLVFVWALRFCKMGAPSVDVNGRGPQLFVGACVGPWLLKCCSGVVKLLR